MPEKSYVNRVLASNHDANTVYAAFDNHKEEDFAPYFLKSTDAGRNWTAIKGDLPESGPVWSIAEDPVNPNLLFVGTEFALFFSNNGGQKWIRLQGGLPTIAVSDLAIQKQTDDLVLATFGRSFYILDDYSPLRTATQETLDKETALFPVKDTMMYLEASPIGGRGKAFQGETYFNAPNPPAGATFTYYLKSAIQTKRQKRQAAERAAERAGGQPPAYPTVAELRAEEEEEAPVMVFTVSDAEGHVVRRLDAPATLGIHRVTWDMRYPSGNVPAAPGGGGRGGGGGGAAAAGEGGFQAPGGALVMPGEYKVTLAKRVGGVTTDVAGPLTFHLTAEGVQQMAPADRAALVEFQRKVGRLQNAVSGALEVANSTDQRLNVIRRAVDETPAAGTEKLRETARGLQQQLSALLIALRGDTVAREHQEPSMSIGISERVNTIAGEERLSTARPTQTHLDNYRIAAEEFAPVLEKLRALVTVDLANLEKQLDALGVPHTPGRIPDWKDK